MTEPAPDAPPPAPRRRLVTRRRFLAGALGSGAALSVGVPWLWRITPPPRLDAVKLDDDALALWEAAWAGLDPTRVVDVHVHVLGMGIGGTGCYVHEEAHSLRSPVRLLKTRFYKGAAGIHDDARADALFVERLVDLARHPRPRGRYLLLAFDEHRAPDGTVDRGRTEFHTPNDHVAKVVAAHPELFLFGCSVHPYRTDALAELERCAALGAVAVKWLPNAMGIDPLDPRCEPFYAKLVELGLPLLTHAGEEQAVHAEEAQELGNPLRMRRALELGATVIVAHCASLGASLDLDALEGPGGQRPRVSSYRLLRRMLAEERWKGRLFADVSATTQFNRVENALAELLATPGLHPRLLNGSDYPLPAIDPLVRLGQLVDLGLLDPKDRPALKALYAYDPIAFDFTLKRRVRALVDGQERRFGNEVFEAARAFPRLSGGAAPGPRPR